jgi:hypothetical protein
MTDTDIPIERLRDYLAHTEGYEDTEHLNHLHGVATVNSGRFSLYRSDLRQLMEAHVDLAAEVRRLRAELDTRWPWDGDADGYADWLNDLMENMGDEWDDDASAESIVTRYVRWLEAELDHARPVIDAALRRADASLDPKIADHRTAELLIAARAYRETQP